MRYISIPGIGEVLLERSGFNPSSAALIRQGKQTISDEVADALCTVGGEKTLEKRVEEFQKLGVSIAIVSSPTELKKVAKDLGDLQSSF